jgi:FkbM family methyltransferase
MKIWNKISDRFLEFKKHPVTSNNEFKALFRYIQFNVFCRISNQIVYAWIKNLKFYARQGDAGIVGNIYFGLYEFEESIFLIHFLEKEDIFLDIGANVGHYSILMSGINRCISIAIEPVPDTFNQLQNQIKLNGLENLIISKNIGISNSIGTLFFSNDRGTMDSIVNENYDKKVLVQVSTIDEIIGSDAPIAVKIDVEGYEKFVLEGAKKTLQNNKLKIVILELNQSGEKFGMHDNDLYLIMLSYGFKPFRYDYYLRKIILLDGYNKEQFNTIFVRDTNFVSKRVLNSKKIKIINKYF